MNSADGYGSLFSSHWSNRNLLACEVVNAKFLIYLLHRKSWAHSHDSTNSFQLTIIFSAKRWPRKIFIFFKLENGKKAFLKTKIENKNPVQNVRFSPLVKKSVISVIFSVISFVERIENLELELFFAWITIGALLMMTDETLGYVNFCELEILFCKLQYVLALICLIGRCTKMSCARPDVPVGWQAKNFRDRWETESEMPFLWLAAWNNGQWAAKVQMAASQIRTNYFIRLLIFARRFNDHVELSIRNSIRQLDMVHSLSLSLSIMSFIIIIIIVIIWLSIVYSIKIHSKDTYPHNLCSSFKLRDCWWTPP